VAVAAASAPSIGAPTNVISTVAGTGVSGDAGDGGPANAAQLSIPLAVTALPDGGYLIVHQGAPRVRRVAPNGTISTVAGNGTAGFSGDGGPATAAQLNAPNAAVMAPDGGILISDSNNNRVRRVAPDGTISTVAGTGSATYGGDGVPAVGAPIAFPIGLAITPDGGYLIGDNDNHRVRKVGPDGTISTVAGTGSPGFSGDGGPGNSAALNGPAAVAAMPDGGFLISDQDNHRVRRVFPDGTINTVAGSGTSGFSGDGGPATAAALNGPSHMAPTADGGFVLADRFNNRVRKVAPDGMIGTVAGVGTAGFSGDGGLATAAELNNPIGLAVNAEGDYLIADTSNHRVRLVDAGEPPPPPPPPPPGLPPPARGETLNATPVTGTVLVKRPARRGSRKAGAHGAQVSRFLPLTAATQVPIGTTFDTRRGTVALNLATNRSGTAIQTGTFNGGLFITKQTRKSALTTMVLTGGGLKGCKTRLPRGGAPKPVEGAQRRRGRRLFSNARGRFRTRGRNSTATVRGTQWLQKDTCAGTLTRVTAGSVRVRDLAKRRTKVVRAGKRYFARAPKPRPRNRRR
jgi:hypothetical protein